MSGVMYCPSCFKVVKDWRGYSEPSAVDKCKPFECTGLRCGKRWDLSEVLQEVENGEGGEPA